MVALRLGVLVPLMRLASVCLIPRLAMRQAFALLISGRDPGGPDHHVTFAPDNGRDKHPDQS